ncbi:MAG: hypothetical protein GC189_06125 [Alphaproteobacteria bacterium]|nr:hypothetical protein [Alphaproteobacteria bacterium]
MSMQRRQDDKALKPVGLALAAVVAGIAAPAGAHGALVEQPLTRAHADDPSNHAGFEEDASMIVGRSAPVEPFADPTPAAQGNLFDL